MRRLWCTSDQHYGHARIIDYCSRDFSSVDEMNASLIERFNAHVQPEDLTYHLGDFSLKESMVPLILPRLNGEHILIPGNHDKVHPHQARKKQEEITKRYLDYGFKEIHLQLELDEFIMAHMPYDGKGEYDVKYKQYRPLPQEGKMLLMGHIHTAWRYKHSPAQYNVGVDVNGYAPISLEEIRAFLKEATNDC